MGRLRDRNQRQYEPDCEDESTAEIETSWSADGALRNEKLSRDGRDEALLTYRPGVKEVAGILVFAAPACWLAWVCIRVLRSPEDSWAKGQSRWIAVVPLRKGERPPSASELRFWAAAWLAIAAAILALGLALGLSQ